MKTATKVTHTPGPWELDGFEVFKWLGFDDEGTPKTSPIAEVTAVFDEENQRADVTSQANAHLVAAAPDMLEALESAQRAFRNIRNQWTAIPAYASSELSHHEIAIAAAIAKAKGGAA